MRRGSGQGTPRKDSARWGGEAEVPGEPKKPWLWRQGHGHGDKVMAMATRPWPCTEERIHCWRIHSSKVHSKSVHSRGVPSKGVHSWRSTPALHAIVAGHQPPKRRARRAPWLRGPRARSTFDSSLNDDEEEAPPSASTGVIEKAVRAHSGHVDLSVCPAARRISQSLYK